jgi:hypothetical protein
MSVDQGTGLAVLRSTGTLLTSIVHPFVDRGRFAGPEADAAFVVQGSEFY